MTHKSINVADAKKRLSELLGRVSYRGEEFVIARRGRPVARLVPLRPAGQPHLASLKGWLDDDDPFFEALDEIVASRARHVPRVVRRRIR
ncbi:MAG: type II toxin-antitoxin system prevent-host-death family antitoxin [Planctomycetales bacterium]|nr:type II toxin-antitoxin system prevent-host-death family antitoxin [Planctomycetales bacterium]